MEEREGREVIKRIFYVILFWRKKGIFDRIFEIIFRNEFLVFRGCKFYI